MGTLKIEFNGICVHFRDIIPGVRHRVVLPDAMNVYFGLVRTLSQGDNSAATYYYLLPHYAFMRPEDGGEPTGEHWLLEHVHLRVQNPKAGQLLVGGEDGLHSLSDYVPRTMTISHEVVMGGRAAAYFDFDEGIVTVNSADGRLYTTIEVETVGTPEIAMTKFPGATGPVGRDVFRIEAPVLNVSNVDFDTADEDADLDFLLNYLVSREGIPRFLTQPVPGMGNEPVSASPSRFGEALIGLGQQVATNLAQGALIPKSHIDSFSPDVLTASCSNSTWP